MKFLIWSNEHDRWWKSNANGYTEYEDQAGLFSFNEAATICLDANKYQMPNAKPNEMMFPVRDPRSDELTRKLDPEL
jgi:hypothetical protein